MTPSRENLVGVDRAVIAECEAGMGVKLPAAYVAFLESMGAESGRFKPFGASMDHSLYELVEALSDDDEPGGRYFRIALEGDLNMIPVYDMFLDLGRGDDVDAPLVRFEAGVETNPDSASPTGFSFLEYITLSAYKEFDAAARPEKEVFMIRATTPEEKARAAGKCSALLETDGMRALFTPLPRVRCMGRDDASARVEIEDRYGMVVVRLAADDRVTMGRLVELFLDSIPEATLDRDVTGLE